MVGEGGRVGRDGEEGEEGEEGGGGDGVTKEWRESDGQGSGCNNHSQLTVGLVWCGCHRK